MYPDKVGLKNLSFNKESNFVGTASNFSVSYDSIHFLII